MYVYQNDKLYVQHEDGLFGVEIYPDEVIVLKDEKTVLGKEFELLTLVEVQARFHEGYKFPKKEVKANVATGKAKTGSRKPRRK